MIARLALLTVLVVAPLAAAAQELGPSQFSIKADDGEPISNHALSAAEMAQVEKLPGLVDATTAKGNVTLYQFYDLNCPYCRAAAADVDKLINADPALHLVFVPYPVLSVQSVEGSRVELAVRELAPQRFLEFHRKVYAGRGVIDGARALAVTDVMGLDRKKIIEIADTQRVTDTMVAHSKVGAALKLMATPSYVVQGVALVGHPGFEPLRSIIAAVRRCKAVVCGS
jgi:protein-disulfide isomerase